MRDAPRESPAPEFPAAWAVNHPPGEALGPSTTPIGQVVAFEEDGKGLPSDLGALFADKDPSGEPPVVDRDDEGDGPVVIRPCC